MAALRMHERPIGDLVDALRPTGRQIDYLGNEGYPPLRIAAAIAACLPATEPRPSACVAMCPASSSPRC